MKQVLQHRIDSTFAHYDVNGNGVIELADIYALANRLLRAFGEPAASERGRDLVEAYDRFWEMLVDHCDADRDGKIGPEEYREAMIEAERTARPTATGKVVLVQDRQSLQPGFLIYMPVFEAAPGGRRLRGFIYSPFNAEDFLSSALALEDAASLAAALGRYDDHERAFAAFQSDRQERVERVVAYAAAIDRQKKTSGNRFAVAIRDLLLPLFLRNATRDTRYDWVFDYALPEAAGADRSE